MFLSDNYQSVNNPSITNNPHVHCFLISHLIDIIWALVPLCSDPWPTARTLMTRSVCVCWSWCRRRNWPMGSLILVTCMPWHGQLATLPQQENYRRPSEGWSRCEGGGQWGFGSKEKSVCWRTRVIVTSEWEYNALLYTQMKYISVFLCIFNIRSSLWNGLRRCQTSPKFCGHFLE